MAHESHDKGLMEVKCQVHESHITGSWNPYDIGMHFKRHMKVSLKNEHMKNEWWSHKECMKALWIRLNATLELFMLVLTLLFSVKLQVIIRLEDHTCCSVCLRVQQVVEVVARTVCILLAGLQWENLTPMLRVANLVNTKWCKKT